MSAKNKKTNDLPETVTHNTLCPMTKVHCWQEQCTFWDKSMNRCIYSALTFMIAANTHILEAKLNEIKQRLDDLMEL